MQESRTTDHAQQVHYNKTQKEQEFEKNVDKHVKAKQDDQNKRFLDSMLKDKQVMSSSFNSKINKVFLYMIGKKLSRRC